MNIFQKAFTWVKSLKLPKWLKILFKEVQVIVVDVLKQFTKDQINWLTSEIVRQSTKDISGSNKLSNVADSFKSRFTGVNISTQMINLVIEILLGRLKANNTID